MRPLSLRAFRPVLAVVAFAGVTVPVAAQTVPPGWRTAVGPSIPFSTAQTPRYGATISGWVKLEDGRPAVGYTVHANLAAWPDGGANPNTAVTDGHGWYRIRASPQVRMNYSGPGLDPNGPRGYLVWVSKDSRPFAEQISGTQTVDTDALPRHRATHVDFVLLSRPQGRSAHS